MSRPLRLLFLVAATLGLAVVWRRSTPTALPALVDLSARATYQPFWVETAGGRLALEDLRGQAVVVYFGYTSCPDFCPTTMATLAAAVAGLDPAARSRVTAVMVSLDPERDTPARLAEYVAFFDPSFHGGTRRPEELGPITQDWGVVYRKVPTPGSAMGWSIDHTTDAVLVGPDGRVIERIPHGTPPDQVRERLRAALGPPPG